MVAIIAGRMCVLFPRSRWAKLDDALDWVGVLTEMHGLLQTSYRLWYKKVTGRNPPPMSAGGAGGVGAFDHAALVDADVDHDLPDLVPDPADAEADPVDAAAEDERAAAVGDAVPEKSAAEKSKDRNAGIKFASIPNLRSVCTSLRMVCTPMFDFMHSSLDQGGARWERLQYAKATKGLPREYRATNAAQLKLEGRASEDLRILATDVSKWEVISLAGRNVAFQNDQFKLISTVGCGISHKHTRLHTNFPIEAFPWVFSQKNLSEHFDEITCKQRLGPFLQSWYEWFVTQPGGVDSRGARR